MIEEIKKAIKQLAMLSSSGNSLESLQRTQAMLNLAHTIQVLKTTNQTKLTD